MIKKCLLIGVDGLQYQRVLELSSQLPNFRRFTLRQGYTGGGYRATSSQDTNSGPGWATILTGVWANRHGITSNSESLRVNPEFPSILSRLKNAMKKDVYVAAVAGWTVITAKHFKDDLAHIDRVFSIHKDDEDCLAKTRQCIDESGSKDTMIYVAFADPDYAGHDYGFGPQYDAAIKNSDRRIGVLLDKVASSADEWLVLLTTDHGRQEKTGKDHGDDTYYERTLIVGGLHLRPGRITFNTEFEEVVLDPPEKAHNHLFGTISQASFAPTIGAYFGLEIPQEALMAAPPLVYINSFVRKLRVVDKTFTWINLDIGRQLEAVTSKGRYIIPPDQTTWTAPDDTQPSSYVSFRVAGYKSPWVSADTGPIHIRSTIDWSPGTAMLFLSTGKFSLYDYTLDRVADGYPKEVNESTWPGLAAHVRDIIGGYPTGNGDVLILLKGGRYMKCDFNRKVIVHPTNMAVGTWGNIASNHSSIVTTMRGRDNIAYVFFTANRYIAFDPQTYRPNHEGYRNYSEGTWPGLPSAVPHSEMITGGSRASNDLLCDQGVALVPRTTRPTLLFAIPFVFAMQACGAMNGTDHGATFHTQQSAADARHQLADWIPRATHLANAVKTLEGQGFHCQAMQPANAQMASTTQCSLAPAPTSLPAERETAPLTPIQWFVTLNSTDGETVSELLVNRFPRDLGA
ncbi:hypothetical protein KCV01_g13508, partial [Aureobasidium melanogenum]